MCTRVFNNKSEDYLTTSRNMDWKTQLPTSLFTFKKGLNKSGMESNDDSALTWTSVYDSVVTMVGNEESGYGASDGMNSNGLVANVLYDSNAEYLRKDDDSTKKLDVLRWVQYVLDMYGTVSDVVSEFNKNNIQIVGSRVPGSESEATLHLSISDKHSDSAIIELVDGKFCIHLSKAFTIMTNEPNFETQIKLNDYWRWQWSSENKFPSHTIPGGPFPTDRFERAAFYLHHIDAPINAKDSLAQSKSIVANASVPIGFNLTIDDNPNVAPTLWSTISDHNNLIYYFYNVRTPNVVWLNLNQLSSNYNVAKLNMVELTADNQFISHNYDNMINDNLIPTTDTYQVKPVLLNVTL